MFNGREPDDSEPTSILARLTLVGMPVVCAKSCLVLQASSGP